MRPYQFITANVFTRLVVALAQTAIFLIVGMKLFHIQMAGSYWLLLMCIILGSVMFLGLGFSVFGLCTDDGIGASDREPGSLPDAVCRERLLLSGEYAVMAVDHR